MAQDSPQAFGQGYPHGYAGQEPTGYDYQQPWYPEQQAATGDQWATDAGYQQQPQAWSEHPPQAEQQWHTGLPQQPDQTGGYYYDGSVYTGYPAEQQQQLYAPPGTEYQAYGGYQGEQTGYAYPPAEPAHDPFGTLVEEQPAEPALHTEPYTEPYAEPFAEPFADPYADPYTEPSPHAVSESESEFRSEDDFDAPPGGRTSLVDRAKAAAGKIISAEHAPSRRTLVIRAGAGAAALVVLLTAAVLATSGGSSSGGSGSGDSAPAPGFAVAHAKSWTAAAAAAADGAPASDDDSLAGSWLLGNSVVRADSTGIRAYELTTGKVTWTLPVPAQGGAFCGLSPTVNSAGIGAALYRPQAKGPCSQLLAVDTKSGKSPWNKSLSDTKDAYAAHVSVNDDAVIAVGDDKAVAQGAADGKDVWQYTGPGKFCTLSGGASGKTVLLHTSCADSDPGDQAVALNAADGKLKWWRGLNNQPKTATVLSAEPAVILTTGDKPADDRVLAWGPTGDPGAQLPVAADNALLAVTKGAFDAIPSVFFKDQTMVTTLAPAGGGPTAAIAYDLATGKALWKTAVSEKGQVRSIGMDGGALVVAVDERLDQPAHLSRFALGGGQETAGGGFPKATGSLLTSGRVLVGGGQVVVLPEHSANFGIATAFQAKG